MPKIINFHDIYDKQWFEDTLDVIQDLYEIVPFAEIERFYQGKSKGKNQVHLTVDDGHISTYSLIYPALKARNLTASIFVSPKIIQEQTNFWYFESGDYDKEKLRVCIAQVLGIPNEKFQNLYPRSVMKTLTLAQNGAIIALYQNNYNEPTKKGQYITVDQLLELEQSGFFEIGAHTMNHPILANENDEVSRYEIQQSVEDLGKLLHRKVTTFAYPNGSKGLDFGPREIQFLKECGVKHAFSFEFKDLHQKDNLWSIPRYGLYHGNQDFVRKKLKYGRFWEPVKARLFNNEDKYRKKISQSLPLSRKI